MGRQGLSRQNRRDGYSSVRENCFDSRRLRRIGQPEGLQAPVHARRSHEDNRRGRREKVRREHSRRTHEARPDFQKSVRDLNKYTLDIRDKLAMLWQIVCIKM